MLAAYALVLAEHIADLPRAYTDIASRNVRIGTDILAEFGHEALTEAHDLAVRFPLGIEIRAALASTDRKTGQTVLEDLLEAKKLENGKIDRRMKAQAALIGTDCAVELDAIPPIDLNLTRIVYPGNAESDHALRFDKALQQAGLFVFGMPVKHK